MERKQTHYRLYKAKKQWITACSVVIVGTGLAMMNATVAHADTVTDSNNEEKTPTTTGTMFRQVYSENRINLV